MVRISNIAGVMATVTLLALSFTSTAAAQGPARPDLINGGNLWRVTAFDDTSPVHTQLATQGICFQAIGFVGTHIQYRWRSTTFPDWNGIASQEGDQIFMHGDYAKDVGHDGMQWAIASSKTGAGHWFEWREDGGFGITIGFANAEWQRAGTCNFAEAGRFALEQYAGDGTVVENPIGRPTETR